MERLHEVELIEVLPKLPCVEPLEISRYFSGKTDDLYLCSLGFEARCLVIPEEIGSLNSYHAKEGIYFEYSTNSEDNDLNRVKLVNILGNFSGSLKPIQADDDQFPVRLREDLTLICSNSGIPSVSFDISTCSSKTLLIALKVLLEFDIDLHILYSEADVYHPTKQEYRDQPEKWTTEEGFGLARGVGKVVFSPEFHGYRRDQLPESIVVFPTFKPERTRAIITQVDESLIIRPKDRIVWMIGVPHLSEDRWRADIVKEINRIPEDADCHEVSTFDYKQTLETLEMIYRAKEGAYSITISALGSKFQAVGIALFWYIRQNVSIAFAMPERYNALQYSEGSKATWMINLGNLREIEALLDTVGQLQILP